jgi:CRISPR-associated endonuclease/helicase Cas3
MAKMYGVSDSKLEDELIAHWRRRDQEAQLLLTHLTETAQFAERFAAKVGLSEIGKISGLLHDFGKASEKYQRYLRSGEGLINPDEDAYIDPKAQKGKIDHSTAGAQLAHQKLASRGREGKFLAQFLALAIASHHSGLINCLTPEGKNDFQRRIGKPDEDTHFSEAVEKLPGVVQQLDEILTQSVEHRFYKKLYEELKEVEDSKETLTFKRGLLARFLLSCLLDADRLNTADFENPENELMRNYGKYRPWSVLIERLEIKFEEYTRATEQMDKSSRAYEVNLLRAQVAQACLDFSQKPKGIYRLTAPTGGAKTMASLRFALHHAEAHKIDRIFYVVPYITIIDQNADEVRRVLEDKDKNGRYLEKVVLEHHSNLTPEEETRRHNLLAENWDAPVIFTTQVQFLESLFNASTRDARRMHQLANSIIILDEVQTIPIKMTHLFNIAMRFLVHDCGATVLLCTATQPPFENTGNDYRGLTIPPENHIIQNEQELFEKLKRVEVYDERKPGGWTGAEIADLAEHALNEKGSVLIVVNTRASASMLYQEIKGRNLAETHHLSTNMCPAHRLDVLAKVRAKLEAGEPVICVSTQLIEAGVDIDFGAVIRALAGLDSIAQSAGRCNRHGVREGLGSVWVVNPIAENLDKLPDIKAGREKAQTVLDDFKDDVERFGSDRIGLSAIADYYRYYFQIRENEMDYPVGANSIVERNDDLFNLLASNTLSVEAHKSTHQAAPDILLRQSFQSAGKLFHVIDSVTRGVVVPYKDGETVIADLCGAPELEKQYKLLKRAQRYSVNLFTYQFDKLLKTGAIKEVQPEAGIYHLDEQYYSNEFGWSDEPVGDMKLLIAE